jgi:hypothetical protein
MPLSAGARLGSYEITTGWSEGAHLEDEHSAIVVLECRLNSSIRLREATMHQALTPQGFLTEELFNPRPNGPLLWRLRFGASVLDAHLCDAGCWGVAYRLYLNGRFTYSERFDCEDLARQAAADVLIRRVGGGWMEDQSIRQTA